MKPADYDFVSIGGGSAGFNAARVAADLGMRVAVVDGARKLGGLCILRGCMPSKTLIYSAEVLHLAKQAKAFGLHIPKAAADMPALHSRKRKIIGEFANDRNKSLRSGKFQLIESNARFADPNTLELDDGARIRARSILIGTGSRVSVPPVPGLKNSRFWTSDDILDLDFVPRSILVLGGGVVACELAQFLRRIGSRVCQIQRSPHLLREGPAAASEVIRGAFEEEGIEVFTDTRILDVATTLGRTTVRFVQGARTITRSADHLLNALGREPSTGALNLEAAGVKADEKGRIGTNKWQQTNVPHIYAAGDCAGPHEIVHIAIQQAELAARHAAGIKGIRPLDPALLLGVVFTDPQVATIGFSERELEAREIKFLSASYPFNDHGKSILMNAGHGYVKVMAEPKRGRILGAEIVGKDAGELIHCFSTPLAMGATVHDMLRAPWYHPTLAEIVTYPLEEIADALSRPDSARVQRH